VMSNFINEVEREVWKTVRELNDTWTKGNPEELKNYFHVDMVALTPTDKNRREGREACVADWVEFAKAAKIHSWKEIDPKIQMYGDVAVVTYYFDISFEKGGQTINFGGRDLFVFVKEGGRWWAVADHFSPNPI
jgi:ketosteroid isomerase-like protein